MLQYTTPLRFESHKINIERLYKNNIPLWILADYKQRSTLEISFAIECIFLAQLSVFQSFILFVLIIVFVWFR